MKGIIKIVWVDGQDSFKSFDVLKLSDIAAKLLIEKNKDNPRPRYIALEDGLKFGIVEKVAKEPATVPVSVPVPVPDPEHEIITAVAESDSKSTPEHEQTVEEVKTDTETIQKRKYNKKK